VRLREATLADADRLAELYAASGAPHKDAASIRAWLVKGGCLLVERQSGPVLAAVRWLPTNAGWQVERVTTRPDERGNGFGRWLMTKLEAMAIKGNVPLLDLDLDDEGLLPYYRRMGYRQDGPSPLHLTKRVGGVWQRQVAP
jgi:GNAT superfamily N-acetyltransferase